MSHDSGKWTDLRILASFSWQHQLVSGRNGSHNDHLPPFKGKKKSSSFSAWVNPRSFHLLFFHDCLCLRVTLQKRKPAGQLHFKLLLESRLHGNPTPQASDPKAKHGVPLLLEEVTYAPETLGHSWHSILFVDKIVPFFIILLLTPRGSDFTDLKGKSPELSFPDKKIFENMSTLWSVKRGLVYCECLQLFFSKWPDFLLRISSRYLPEYAPYIRNIYF